VNWIARSSQELDHKLLFLSYRDRWDRFRTGAGTFIAAHSPCIGLAFLLLLGGWAVYSWFLTIERIVRYYNPLPIWDYWNVVQHLPQYRAFDLRVLWIQHNEHRIVFPEIIFALDMLVLHGRQVLPLEISFICYFSTWLIMSWTILSAPSLSRTIRFAAILLAGIIIGWQGCVLALGIPFLLNWTLTQFASVLALAFLFALKNNSRFTYLAGTITCGTIATYSSANGMLVWPVIIVAGLVSSLQKRYIFAVVVAATLNISVYFVDFRILHHVDIYTLITHPGYLLGFIASYVSMPYGVLKARHFGVWIGLANLLMFVFMLVITARARLLGSAPSIVLFGYFVFTVLTAFITAAGRMNLNDTTFITATASRYLTIPLANWGALLIALIWLSGTCRWRLVSPRAIVLTAVVVLLVTFPKLMPWVSSNDVFFAQQQWATLTVENGLFDPDIARFIFPGPAFIKPLVQLLRDDHLSLFYKGYSASLGQPFTSRFPQPSRQSRHGGVTQIHPVSGGLEIVGWTDGARPERVAFVNESGRIIGLGRKLPAGVPPNLPPDTPSALAWVGFINSNFESNSFVTYSFGPHSGRPTPVIGRSSVPASQAGQ
jgi:hypothetical protein